MGKKKKAIVTTVIRYLIILIFCVPMIMPLLWMLTTALKDNAAVFAMPPQWIPKVFHWENFTIGLQQIEFWKRFGNTVFISVIVCFGQVCSCMSVGYALARLRFPGKKVWFYLIVGSMMIPGMVTVIPVFRLWAACGFYGTWWPMIIPAFLGAPFQTFLAKQFMSGLPKSYDEAARMDGASRLQVLLKVIGPMCKPLIAVNCNPVGSRVPGTTTYSIAVCHFQTGKVDTVPGSRQNDKQYLWNTVEPVYGSRRCLHAPDPDFVLLLSEVLHGKALAL